MELAHDWIFATEAQLAGVSLSLAQEQAIQEVLDKSFKSPEEALEILGLSGTRNGDRVTR